MTQTLDRKNKFEFYSKNLKVHPQESEGNFHVVVFCFRGRQTKTRRLKRCIGPIVRRPYINFLAEQDATQRARMAGRK